MWNKDYFPAKKFNNESLHDISFRNYYTNVFEKPVQGRLKYLIQVYFCVLQAKLLKSLKTVA